MTVSMLLPVRVDEPRDDDEARRVDDLGVDRLEAGPDRRDAVVLDEDVTAEDVADRRVHREHVATLEQHSIRHQRLVHYD
jgi:hypothetical protein